MMKSGVEILKSIASKFFGSLDDVFEYSEFIDNTNNFHKEEGSASLIFCKDKITFKQEVFAHDYREISNLEFGYGYGSVQYFPDKGIIEFPNGRKIELDKNAGIGIKNAVKILSEIPDTELQDILNKSIIQDYYSYDNRDGAEHGVTVDYFALVPKEKLEDAFKRHEQSSFFSIETPISKFDLKSGYINLTDKELKPGTDSEKIKPLFDQFLIVVDAINSHKEDLAEFRKK